MKLVNTQQALRYRPTDPATVAACESFIKRGNEWSLKFSQAKGSLRSFLAENVKQHAKGIASRDGMLMGSFGVVFETNPGAGFIQAPRDIADSVERQSIRGAVYFPDVKTTIGAQVVKMLNSISSIASERPLLNGVNGLKALAVDAGRLVLSGARLIDGAVVVLASKNAVSPGAQLALVAPSPTPHVQVANEFLEKVAQAAAKGSFSGIGIPKTPKP